MYVTVSSIANMIPGDGPAESCYSWRDKRTNRKVKGDGTESPEGKTCVWWDEWKDIHVRRMERYMHWDEWKDTWRMERYMHRANLHIHAVCLKWKDVALRTTPCATCGPFLAMVYGGFVSTHNANASAPRPSQTQFRRAIVPVDSVMANKVWRADYTVGWRHLRRRV